MTKATRRVVKQQVRTEAPDLGAIINDVMSGKRTGRPGAESHGFQSLTALIEVYLLAEGRLADSLRAFVDALCNREDPLRKDIPPELWAALWPAINTMQHARRKALAQIHDAKAKASASSSGTAPGSSSTTPEEAKHERREEEEGRGEGEGARPAAGAGILRDGAGGAP